MSDLWSAVQAEAEPDSAPALGVPQGTSVRLPPMPLQGTTEEHAQDAHGSQTPQCRLSSLRLRTNLSRRRKHEAIFLGR